MLNVTRFLALASFLLPVACGGAGTSIPDGPGSSTATSGGSASGTSPGTSGGTGSGATAPAPGAKGVPGPGPQITLSLRGSITPVPHADAFSSQTPARQAVAVSSLWLYKSASDTAPLEVIDLGTSSVETDLVSGKTNDIATVALHSLPAGTYSLAKVGVAYVRYRIAARLHDVTATDGRYDNTEALSDDAVIDGTAHAKGWFRSEFGIGDTTYASLDGAQAPLPQLPGGGGITLETSGPNSYYVFPVSLTIDPSEPGDQRILCEINVHESFRWQDQSQPGYAAKIFDTTPTTYEPVMSFGASAFSLTVEPK